MLQYPDFDEKQVLFLQSNDVKDMNLENDNLVIKEKKVIKNKISLYKIFVIFLIGETTLTTQLIRKMKDFGITLIFLRNNFDPYLVIGNETEGNFILRKKQYEKTQEEMLEIAKKIIFLKTSNQCSLLKQLRNKDILLKEDILKMEEMIKSISRITQADRLLGVEGNISKIFFGQYFGPIGWNRRSPRTKIDIHNLLLDIGYTYLFHFIDALLRLYGFDNYYGVYHRCWYQRKSLPLDLMEPFRCIIDKALLKAYNLGQINSKDFVFSKGQYSLPWMNAQKYTKIFFFAILDNKKEIFYFIKEYYKFFIKGRDEFPDFKI